MPKKAATLQASQGSTPATTPNKRGPKPGWKKNTAAVATHSNETLPQLCHKALEASVISTIMQRLIEEPGTHQKFVDEYLPQIETRFDILRNIAKAVKPQAMGARA
jgi:hypothetical protein